MIITIQPENDTEVDILKIYADLRINPFIDKPLPSADAIIKWLKEDMNNVANAAKTQEVINSQQTAINSFRVV